MAPRRPSLTASLVAFARGVGTTRELSDPAVGVLLGAPFSSVLGAVDRLPALRPALRAATFGLVDHVSLRTRAIDEAVRDALESGITQVVIVGAGFDRRAFRMDELSWGAVYELDLPVTQARKRRRIGGTPPKAQSLSFVPIDLEAQRISEALASTEHDRQRPTLWLWEGVTPYIAQASIVATLGDMAAASPQGSRLVVTYSNPDAVRFREITEGLFEAVGEPLVGWVTREEFASLLNGAGFRVLSDSNSLEWSRRYGEHPFVSALFRAERLVSAVQVR